MQDLQVRDFVDGGHGIVGKGSRQKRAVTVIGEFFIQCGPDGLCEGAANLAINHAFMQDRTAVMHRDIAVNPRLVGDRINLDPAEIKDKRVAQ